MGLTTVRMLTARIASSSNTSRGPILYAIIDTDVCAATRPRSTRRHRRMPAWRRDSSATAPQVRRKRGLPGSGRARGRRRARGEAPGSSSTTGRTSRMLVGRRRRARRARRISPSPRCARSSDLTRSSGSRRTRANRSIARSRATPATSPSVRSSRRRRRQTGYDARGLELVAPPRAVASRSSRSAASRWRTPRGDRPPARPLSPSSRTCCLPAISDEIEARVRTFVRALPALPFKV